MTDRTTVYTDGACSGNPGPGGWAWIVPDGAFAAGAEATTTNQRMELSAVLDAVRSLDGPLEVISDSAYVVNCFRDRWWEGWLKRGWVNANKKPVANRDLWEPLVEAVRRDDVVFRWVKGHSGDRWNDLADRLAVEAALRQAGRRGDTPPTDVGPADLGGRERTRAEDGPAGHLMVVTGHRPTELGGYDDNDTARAVRDHVIDILIAKRRLHPDLKVLTGLGLGAETLAAEAARDADVPYVAVLAFPRLDERWPDSSRRRFRTLLDAATETVTLQNGQPDSNAKAAAAFRRRDAWLARHADEALVVWDRSDDLVGRQVRSLQDELGEEEVWIVSPTEVG
ncbi:MAG TPA: SLOG family protein [Acidimicrobiia bacterium]|nr:SLOG family protein [Acidimicrobiia bacterium]